jgi:hypothetical protein
MSQDLVQSKLKTEKPVPSVFAQEKTYGEKKHDFIFGTLINFWANLLCSAGFTFWVAHSNNSVKLPFIKEFVPRDIQTNLGKWAEKQFFMKGIENPVTRAERAQSMATQFTLMTPGHIIMIPSVLFGAKYKSAIVNYFDRKHYGDEAMEGAELKARHEAIAMEEKPTVLGALVSRAGSFLATMSVGRFIGTPDNLVNKLGVKTFRGVDPIAIDIGGAIGEGVKKVAPTATNAVNRSFERNGYSWSATQKNNKAMTSIVNGPYNQAVDNFSRYVTQDVLYTLVTSASVHPILNYAKKYIPGLTYTPKINLNRVNLPSAVTLAQPIAAQTPAEPAISPTASDQPATDVPMSKVSHITAESTLAAKPERAFTTAGA